MLDVYYSNQKATRNRKVNKTLESILKEVSNELGIDFDIYSGGQVPKSAGGINGKNRVSNTTNHDDHGHGGGAADVVVRDKKGKPIDLESNPELKEKVFKRLAEKGANEFGYGKNYNQGTTSMHVGNSQPGEKTRVWGDDHTYKTADPLLAKLFSGMQPKLEPIVAKQWKNPNADEKYVPQVQGDAAARVWQNNRWTSPTSTQYTTEPTKKLAETAGAEYSLGLPESSKQQNNVQVPGKRSKVMDLVPYLSNIYASTQKPASVPQPVFNAPISLARVNMDNDRYEANRDYRNLQLNADQTLDANTAAYYKLAGKAGKFNQLSKVNQAERNQNNEIANREVLANADIAQGNNAMLLSLIHI
jgi:hypothetical protein